MFLYGADSIQEWDGVAILSHRRRRTLLLIGLTRFHKANVDKFDHLDFDAYSQKKDMKLLEKMHCPDGKVVFPDEKPIQSNGPRKTGALRREDTGPKSDLSV
ncbi:MAG TPA: hypothetical protein PL182_00200 [Pseudobdellovibrionaceae bacterium]|mgnify:CR=1 FL=1|nr:hypothetical protein [Pseudobdellovibrionaceae bacterium]